MHCPEMDRYRVGMDIRVHLRQKMEKNMQQNVTLRIDSELLKQCRHLAVEQNKSLSRWLSDLVTDIVQKEQHYQEHKTEALKILEQGIKYKGKMPIRNELYDR